MPVYKRTDQRVSFDKNLNATDVTGARDVEIQIRSDGKVIWINEGSRCLLRVCCIAGQIKIEDMRPAKGECVRIPV